MTQPNPERRVLADFTDRDGDTLELVFVHGEMFLQWSIAGGTSQPGGVIPISPEALDHFATKVWCPKYAAACRVMDMPVQAVPNVLPENVVRLRP